jgi:SET domain-containing protein
MENNEKSLDDIIEVKYSDIHGYGIFSRQFIPKDQKVLTITGEVIDLDECLKREEEGNVYIFWNGDNYIDVAKSDKIKYLNHHCDSNCTVIDGDEYSLNLISIRDIQPGEEITIDYGYDEIYEECRCSACVEGIS